MFYLKSSYRNTDTRITGPRKFKNYIFAGPITEDTVRHQIKAGRIQAGDQISESLDGTWTHVCDHPFFSEMFWEG